MGGNDERDGRVGLRRRGALVVGTDGSATATKAVEAAARLAATQGQPLVVATGYHPRSRGSLAAAMHEVPEADQWRVSPGAVGEEVVQRAIAHVREVVGAEVDLRGRCEPGDPVRVLLGLADELDAAAVVVGNVGLTGWSGHWSVPQRVVRKARREVLVVDTDAWARRGEPVDVPASLVLRRAG